MLIAASRPAQPGAPPPRKPLGKHTMALTIYGSPRSRSTFAIEFYSRHYHPLALIGLGLWIGDVDR